MSEFIYFVIIIVITILINILFFFIGQKILKAKEDNLICIFNTFRDNTIKEIGDIYEKINKIKQDIKEVNDDMKDVKEDFRSLKRENAQSLKGMLAKIQALEKRTEKIESILKIKEHKK
ncbi:MAG: hypothetical protein NZ608_07080 [candidate division WOR-3 bacterium]|nr:hypothetical protein [candidate division WOR-3 bacterium]